MTSGEPKSNANGFKHLKTALTGLAIAGVATGSFIRWQNSSSRLEGLVLHQMEAGDSKGAYEQLSTLQSKIPLPQLLLYQAYALRQSDLINRANQRLSQAAQILEKEPQPLKKAQKNLLLEISLNQALNGHLTHDKTLFKEGLSRAISLQDNNPWVYLFQALEAQTNKNFIEAGSFAQKATKRTYLSPWMKTPFSSVFGKYWIEMVQIRALVEQGKTVSAKEIIGQIPPKEPSCQEELRFLNCLNNVKEGAKKPFDISLPYFELAFSLIKNISSQQASRFSDLYNEIAQGFENQGQRALALKEMEDLSFYIQALSKWHDNKHLEPLATHYIEWLCDRQMSDDLPPVLFQEEPELKNLIDSPQWHDIFYSTLASRIQKAIEEKRWDLIGRFWSITVSSAQVNAELTKTITTVIEQEVEKRFQRLLKDVMKTDDPKILEPGFADLQQLLPLLAQVESDDGKYQIFLQKLTDEATVLIQTPKISPASDEVFGMLINSTNAPQPERIRIMLKDRITKRFWQARNLQDMASMSTLFDICIKTGLDAIPTYSPDAIANIIADAKFMIENEKIKQAHDQLQWVLKIDPENEQARVILGYSYFNSGEFAKAADIFEALKNPTRQTRQLLAISYLKSNQDDKALESVLKIEAKGEALSDRLNFEVALLKASKEQWKESLQYLQNIRQKNPDVWIYILASEYKLSDTKGVWNAYNELPSLMKANRPVCSLVLRSAQKIELWGLADTVLEKAMNVDPSQAIISQNANEFLKKSFGAHEIDISLAAAQYLQESKQNPKRALEILQGKDETDWYVLSQRAKALIQMGSYKEAYTELLKAPSELPIDEAHLSYWILKSQCLRLQGRLSESLSLIESIEANIKYAPRDVILEKTNLMLEGLRFDIAINLLEKIVVPESSFDDVYLLGHLLAEQGEFDKATKWLDIASRKDLSAWAAWRIAMARWPVDANRGSSIQIPSKNLFEVLTADQKAIVLQKMLETDAYAQALVWGQIYESDLEDSFESSMARMHLHLVQKQLPQARIILEKLSMNPDLSLSELSRLLNWLEILEEDALLEKMTTQTGLPSTVSQISQSQRYKSFLTYLSFAKVVQNKKGVLAAAMNTEIKAINKNTEMSRLDQGSLYDFWIHASSSIILADMAKADTDLQICSKACASFIDPYIQVSSILKQSKAMGLAVDPLQAALKLNPGNPWLEFNLARVEFELSQKTTQAVQDHFIDESKQILQRALQKAPYMASAYVLKSRIAAYEQNWSLAYDQLMIANQLRPADPNILRFIQSVLTKRIEAEGSNLDWTQQLNDITRQLSQIR